MKIDKCPANNPEPDGPPCGYRGELADPFYCPHCDAYYRGVRRGIKVKVEKADLVTMGLLASS